MQPDVCGTPLEDAIVAADAYARSYRDCGYSLVATRLRDEMKACMVAAVEQAAKEASHSG